jgi:hypothetical protein
MRRREQRRKERDHDSKSLRRLSAASSRLERMAPSLHDLDEDGRSRQYLTGSRSRGRSEKRRSSHYYPDFTMSDLPQLPEARKESPANSPQDETPPTPIDKDSIRSVSMTRSHRPIPPPKEGVIRSARSRGSTLHLVTTSDALGMESGNSTNSQQQGSQKQRMKPSQAIIAHWKNWTHWFIENTTKRRRGHIRRTSRSTPDLHKKETFREGSDHNARPQTSKYPSQATSGSPATASLPKGVVANGHANRGHGPDARSGTTRSMANRAAQTPSHPMLQKISTTQAYKRQSLSPSPLTPRTAMRRSSAGLRGRKSTSSSVSSVRSMHHHRHSHSKASSTSSTGSVGNTKTPLGRGQSPHHSVKMLPATPTSNAFPANLRLVRGSPTPLNLYNEGMPSTGPQPPTSPNPFASGVMFAKRKKNLFKGPTLNFGPATGSRSGSGSHSRSASASGLGRRSGEITIQEEDEDYEDEEIEEVEAFSPIVSGPGETIEEQIIEADETTPKAYMHSPTAKETPRLSQEMNGSPSPAGPKTHKVAEVSS